MKQTDEQVERLINACIEWDKSDVNTPIKADIIDDRLHNAIQPFIAAPLEELKAKP